MADNSKIEWTDATWSPIVGCSKVSEGCLNCYAEKMAERLASIACSPKKKAPLTESELAYTNIVQMWHDPKIEKTYWKGWNGKTAFVESALEKPLHWKKPRMIFVCSMGDLLHESVPFDWIDKVINIFEKCERHTGQILTKRSKRMLEYAKYRDYKWPDNVIGMVTAENQKCANERIPDLLQCGFKTTGLSLEPLLEDLDLGKVYYRCVGQKGCGYFGLGSSFSNPQKKGGYKCPKCGKNHTYLITTLIEETDWIIIGAESGPGRRPCKLEWVRNVRDQCKAAGVPVFIKQLDINGKVEHDINKFPEDLRIRQFPK